MKPMGKNSSAAADNGTSTHHPKKWPWTATHQAKMHSEATNGTSTHHQKNGNGKATHHAKIPVKEGTLLKCVLTLVDGESNPSIEKNLEHITKWSTSFAAGWNTFTRDILLQQSRLNPKPLAFAIMANGEPFIQVAPVFGQLALESEGHPSDGLLGFLMGDLSPIHSNDFYPDIKPPTNPAKNPLPPGFHPRSSPNIGNDQGKSTERKSFSSHIITELPTEETSKNTEAAIQGERMQRALKSFNPVVGTLMWPSLRVLTAHRLFVK
jgi:hypothetical protein